MTFVESLYILLQDKITREELTKAHNLLKVFISETQRLYFEGAMSFNVHQMNHIIDSVKRWGPLWSHSGFPFESGNGLVLKKIHAANGVHEQIKRYVIMQLALNHILSKVPTDDYVSKNYCEEISSHDCVQTIKLSEARYFGKANFVDDHWINLHNLSDKAGVYKRMTLKDCVYSSCEKECEKSNNSFAELDNQTIVQIHGFIVDEITRKELMIYKVVNIESAFENSLIFLNKIINVSNDLQVIDTNSVKKPCVAITCDDCTYICSVPNIWHY